MKEQIRPKWAKKPVASKYSGLSIRLLDNLIHRGHIRSSLVRQPGCKRGARLIDLDSLDEFIEAGIGDVADLEMNQTRSSNH